MKRGRRRRGREAGASRESLSLVELRAELERRGIRPAKRLGQHFLVDRNLNRAVARASGVAEGAAEGAAVDNVVLEVGPGAGHLTEALLETGARVVAFEVDPRLASLVRERLTSATEVTEDTENAGEDHADADLSTASVTSVSSVAGRLRLVEADVLSKAGGLNPLVGDILREELASAGRDSFVVASNLPYGIAATFLIALAGSGLPWSQGAVVLQYEVAERLAARVGTKAYGAASVLWQLFARGRIERRIAREVFWPRPDVESAVLVIEPRVEPLADGPRDVCEKFPDFAGFVKALFSQRRKVLRTALARAASAEAGGFEGEARTLADRALAEAGVDPTVRVEDVRPERILALWQSVRSA